jgi:nucleoside phosphorylase
VLTSGRRLGRRGAGVLAASLVATAVVGGGASSATGAGSHCTSRTLVVSAMPVELGPLLAAERVSRTVHVGNRDFFIGRLRGHPVVLALTGIGPVNARRTTRQAFRLFRCHGHSAIGSVVFSGVAGGDFIGDVLVPRRWTLDGGRHFIGVSRQMLRVARQIARRGHVRLERTNHAGDPLCLCATDPDAVPLVTVTHRPRIEIGGKGQTTDPFVGHPFPCLPAGGDVFGCEPCPEQKHLAVDLTTFLAEVGPLISARFVQTNINPSASAADGYVAEDEETAAVAAVARAHHAAFIGFRAVSDGRGDPLHLPGFPFQFLVYRQLSADNAALATLAFLKAWHRHDR